MHINRYRLYCLTSALLLVSCSTLENPAIPDREYTPERDREITEQFNAMEGAQYECGRAFIEAYQKSLYDYCEATGRGKNVGGGCSHIAYAWSINTRLLELGLDRCGKSQPDH